MAVSYRLVERTVKNGQESFVAVFDRNFSCVSDVIKKVKEALGKGTFNPTGELRLVKKQTFSKQEQLIAFPNGQTSFIDAGNKDTVLHCLGTLQKPTQKATKKTTSKLVLSVQSKVADERGKQKITNKDFTIGNKRIQSFVGILANVNPNTLVSMMLARKVTHIGRNPSVTRTLNFYTTPYDRKANPRTSCYVNPQILKTWVETGNLPTVVEEFLGGNARQRH